ncbi:hypothetical protein QBC34DRAFT_385537 [Podospora aff. communis PSN243]|uniref:Uncharacterized protein n=1 Tax=Podospora aff. communis PSN243 TaxID=3040156 RepID=A0AAV9GAG9_9PEZI|nr:hypothetical protein QBC34DRAFT_385537 [Podospora aff. communis PSN243]
MKRNPTGRAETRFSFDEQTRKVSHEEKAVSSSDQTRNQAIRHKSWTRCFRPAAAKSSASKQTLFSSRSLTSVSTSESSGGSNGRVVATENTPESPLSSCSEGKQNTALIDVHGKEHKEDALETPDAACRGEYHLTRDESHDATHQARSLSDDLSDTCSISEAEAFRLIEGDEMLHEVCDDASSEDDYSSVQEESLRHFHGQGHDTDFSMATSSIEGPDEHELDDIWGGLQRGF